MTFAQTIAVLQQGRAVTDVGQLDASTRQFLNRLVGRGVLVRSESYAFPRSKSAYLVPADGMLGFERALKRSLLYRHFVA